MQEHIAIIGSGMAGLAAARILSDGGKRVTVFESHQSRGMDAHTLDIPQAEGAGWVDVPLRVMSPHAWTSVLSLAQHLDVGTFGVDTFVSCSWLDRSTWFRSSRLPGDVPFVGSWRFLNLHSARIAYGLWQLARAIRALENEQDTELTLAGFRDRIGFDPLFWRGLVLPLLTTICTCSEDHLLSWPARGLLNLLGKIVFGDQLLRLRGGTRALVNGLAKDLSFISGSPVVRVQSHADKVTLSNARGEGGEFDRIIIATQANHQGFLPEDLFGRELAALRDIRYDSGELVVHSDTRFMPLEKKHWAALNYTMDRDLRHSMFTVWVNAVEPSLLQNSPIVLQTWNPILPVAPEHILTRVPLQRAVVHPGTAAALARLRELHAEAGRRVFFCGSWAYPGVPLLESAVRSALAVGRHLGVKAAWEPSASPQLEAAFRSA